MGKSSRSIRMELDAAGSLVIGAAGKPTGSVCVLLGKGG